MNVSQVHLWGGPLSISVYAPGDDFERAMREIQRLRHCLPEESSLRVRELASFHVFFDARHSPATSDLYLWENIIKRGYIPDCQDVASVREENNLGYKERLGIPYPVNVGRNIAREMATTHYIFANDAELLPRLERLFMTY